MRNLFGCEVGETGEAMIGELDWRGVLVESLAKGARPLGLSGRWRGQLLVVEGSFSVNLLGFRQTIEGGGSRGVL